MKNFDKNLIIPEILKKITKKPEILNSFHNKSDKILFFDTKNLLYTTFFCIILILYIINTFEVALKYTLNIYIYILKQFFTLNLIIY